MNECDITEKCSFFMGQLTERSDEFDELKEKFCKGSYLKCARYMVIQAAGPEKITGNLYPDEKIVAYQIIAELC